MGSYQRPRIPANNPHDNIKKTASASTSHIDNNISRALGEMLAVIYGKDKIEFTKEVGGEKYPAAYEKLLFDMVVTPDVLKLKKIAAALTNNYNVELIYFIQGKIPADHPRLKFRYVGDYVRILQYQNRTDIVRWINQFRNQFEEEYERIKKSQSLKAHAAHVKSERDFRTESI